MTRTRVATDAARPQTSKQLAAAITASAGPLEAAHQRIAWATELLQTAREAQNEAQARYVAPQPPAYAVMARGRLHSFAGAERFTVYIGEGSDEAALVASQQIRDYHTACRHREAVCGLSSARTAVIRAKARLDRAITAALALQPSDAREAVFFTSAAISAAADPALAGKAAQRVAAMVAAA